MEMTYIEMKAPHARDKNMEERKLAKKCETASSVALEDVAVDISCAAKVTFREYDNYERWCRITVLEILPKNKVGGIFRMDQ